MRAEEQKLCDGCHERPATFYSTICVGDATQSRDLCMTCWQQVASPEELAAHRRIQEIIANGKCKYCGEPAAGGSFCGGLTTMEEQIHLSCEPCRADFAEFMSRPENVMPEDYTDDAAAMERNHPRLKAVVAEADAYVRRRAAERKPEK